MRGRPKSEETASVLGHMSPSSEVTGHLVLFFTMEMTVKSATLRPIWSGKKHMVSSSTQYHTHVLYHSPDTEGGDGGREPDGHEAREARGESGREVSCVVYR